MNLALSNFAWDNDESEIVFKTLKDNEISMIECVLTKLANWSDITPEVIEKYKQELVLQDIIPYSIQSLFYNIKTENLCDVDITIPHIKKLIDYSKILGIKILVLGSPNLRKKFVGWEDKVSKFFKDIDKLLDGNDIKVLIEPNAKVYGGEYFFTLSEIVEFIKKNDLINIRTMVDTHNSILENGNPNIEFINYFDYIKHIHVSEPKLKIISDNDFHNDFAKTLKKNNYKGVVTYEVLKCDEILENLKTFAKIYR